MGLDEKGRPARNYKRSACNHGSAEAVERASHNPTETVQMDNALLEKVERLVDEKYLSLDLPHLD